MPKLLLILVLVGLALRLGWALPQGTDETALRALPDQLEYLALGRNLLSGEGLSFTDARFGTPTYAFRTPGYPALVAASGGSVVAIRVVQSVLDASTIIAVFLLGQKLLLRRAAATTVGPEGSWLALVPAAIVAVSPFQIYFSGLVLTETLFTAMLVWGVVLLVSERRGVWLAGLVVLALSVLVRPGAIGLPTCLAAVAGMARFRYSGLPVSLISAGLVAVMLLPWGYRNQRVLGEWVFTSTNAGITAYDGFNPAADGSSNQGAFVPHMPELDEMTEIQRNNYLLTLAANYRAAHPDRLVDLAARKVARTWSPLPLSESNQSVGKVVVSLAYTLPVWLLALAGLVKGNGGPGLKMLLVTPAVYFTITAALSVGSLRYRIPAEPLLAVLAGSGLGALVLTRKLPEPPQPNPAS